MRDLLFKTARSADGGKVIPHPGLNVTVRKGDKWSTVYPGDQLTVRETESNDVICEARVVNAILANNLMSIPGYLLSFATSPRSRTHHGLHSAMLAAYGEDYYTEGLTILLFWV